MNKNKNGFRPTVNMSPNQFIVGSIINSFWAHVTVKPSFPQLQCNCFPFLKGYHQYSDETYIFGKIAKQISSV